MQSSKDIKLQFYHTDGLLIREMFYTYKTGKKNSVSICRRECYKKYCMFF